MALNSEVLPEPEGPVITQRHGGVSVSVMPCSRWRPMGSMKSIGPQ